jgi:hypothetical protein
METSISRVELALCSHRLPAAARRAIGLDLWEDPDTARLDWNGFPSVGKPYRTAIQQQDTV